MVIKTEKERKGATRAVKLSLCGSAKQKKNQRHFPMSDYEKLLLLQPKILDLVYV